MAADLADVLIGGGLLTPEEARAARAYRSRRGGTLPLAVVELGFCTPDQLAEALARTLRVPLISAEELAALSPSLTSVVPATMAEEHRLIPVKRGNDRLLLAISEPTNQHGMEEVAFFTGLTVVPAVASESDLSAALYYYFGVGAPPPETGPLSVRWQPASGATGEDSAAPMLGQPVELSVRQREESHEFEELDLDEPLVDENRPTPLQPAIQVASAATPEIQTHYSSLDWWLGKDAEPNVVVRKPKHVDAPAAQQDSISHDEVLGSLATTDDIFSEEIMTDAVADPTAAPVVTPSAPSPVTDPQPTGSIAQIATEATAPTSGAAAEPHIPLFTTPTPMSVPQPSPEPPPEVEPVIELTEPVFRPAGAPSITERLTSPATPQKRSTHRMHSPTATTDRLASPGGRGGTDQSQSLPDPVAEGRAIRSTDQLHAVVDPAAEPWTQDPALKALAEATDREQVVKLALPYLLQRWARAAMFVIREGMVLGLDGSGEELPSRVIRGMIVPLNAPSIFKTVYDTGTTFFGPPPKSTINTMCFKALGAEPNLVAVGPLSLGSGAVVALLYADSGASGKADAEDPYFEIVRSAVARALENILVRAKGGR